mgnify:CR=1 FL=1
MPEGPIGIIGLGIMGMPMAKNLLKAKGVEYTEINVQTSMEQRNIMMARSGRRTVPQIFIGDHHVGGFDDMVLLERKGELNALLAG